MSEISAVLHRNDDAQRYSVRLHCSSRWDVYSPMFMQGIAARYAAAWHGTALSTDGHILANFGDPSSSWTLGYNLFADRLLQTNTISDDVSRPSICISFVLD